MLPDLNPCAVAVKGAVRDCDVFVADLVIHDFVIHKNMLRIGAHHSVVRQPNDLITRVQAGLIGAHEMRIVNRGNAVGRRPARHHVFHELLETVSERKRLLGGANFSFAGGKPRHRPVALLDLRPRRRLVRLVLGCSAAERHAEHEREHGGTRQ